MQVYAWRQYGADVGRHPKRPEAPWTSAELDGLPNRPDVAGKIFDRLVIPTGPRDVGGDFRVGVCSDLSPSIGVYHDGMAELSRYEVADRVHVAWIRGFWDSLHVIYRTQSLQEAQSLTRKLVGDARETARRIVPESRLELRTLGETSARAAPYFIYLLVGRGRRAGGVGLLRGSDAVVPEAG